MAALSPQSMEILLCAPGEGSQARERWEELAAQVPSSGNKDSTKIKQGYA